MLEGGRTALLTDLEDYVDKDVEDDKFILVFPDIQKR